jgi:hypothetical protein
VDDGDPDGGPVLDVQGRFVLGLDQLRAVHEATLPAAFDA